MFIHSVNVFGCPKHQGYLGTSAQGYLGTSAQVPYISPSALQDFNSRLPDLADSVFSIDCSVDNLTEHFNLVLRNLLDSVAPAKVRKNLKKSPTPWLNNDVLLLKKQCRKAERQWRKSMLDVFLSVLEGQSHDISVCHVSCNVSILLASD